MFGETIIAAIISGIIGMCGTIGAALLSKGKGGDFGENPADLDPNGITPASIYYRANTRGCSIQIALFLAITLVSFAALNHFALTADDNRATTVALIETTQLPNLAAGIEEGNAENAGKGGQGGAFAMPALPSTPAASPEATPDGTPASVPGGT